MTNIPKHKIWNAPFIGVFVLFAALMSAEAYRANEVMVSALNVPMPDPEFDRVKFQVTWQDLDNILWVTSVLPEDGSFDLAHAIQLDTGLAPIQNDGTGNGTKNGPEWEFTTGNSQILYSKELGPSASDCEVYRAIETAGQWSAGAFPDASSLSYGPTGYLPVGNTRINDPDPAFCFRQLTPDGLSANLAWRKLNTPIGTIVPNATGGGRWASGASNLLVHVGADSKGVTQVYIFNCDTLTDVQVTSSKSTKSSCWMFNAPDLQNEPVIAVLEKVNNAPTTVGIYRKIGTTWYLYNSLHPPSTFLDLNSPEPAIFNGQSYIFCEALNNKDQPSEIWLMGIRTDAPFARMMSDPAIVMERQDPEFLVIPSGLLIYFTQPTDKNIYRCNAGLGPTADQVYTGTGKNNIIQGGAENDYIIGGGGADTLTGGDGVDQFVYFHLSDGGDTINDFLPSTDLLNLNFLEYELGYTGKNPVGDGYVQFKKSGADSQIWIDPDGSNGVKGAVLLVTVKGVPVKDLANLKNFVF